MRSWKSVIEMTEHGFWDPTDEQGCAAVIAEVNRLRKPDDPKPMIRRDDWGEDRKTWLDIHIGETSIRLDPGEHLVSARGRSGKIVYTVIDPEELDWLGAPAAAAAS